jgi:L-amino acid N-acyltransferase
MANAGTLRIIDGVPEAHADAILDILNEAIQNSTALYEYAPRTRESMAQWFDTKHHGRFPVLVAIDASETLVGFASYGTFRERPAYKYSVEHSVYVHVDRRGRGVGLLLMQALVARATEQQYHVMVGGIDGSNRASIAFHEKLGFVRAGTVREAGFKFGRWLDLALYQLILPTPEQPSEA